MLKISWVQKPRNEDMFHRAKEERNSTKEEELNWSDIYREDDLTRRTTEGKIEMKNCTGRPHLEL